jgi:hypothetical protein
MSRTFFWTKWRLGFAASWASGYDWTWAFFEDGATIRLPMGITCTTRSRNGIRSHSIGFIFFKLLVEVLFITRK